jgi:hypothetical protein
MWSILFIEANGRAERHGFEKFLGIQKESKVRCDLIMLFTEPIVDLRSSDRTEQLNPPGSIVTEQRTIRSFHVQD